LEDGVQILFDSPLICEKGEFWERILGKAYGTKVGVWWKLNLEIKK
jgi:hypothetical protein